MMRRRVASALLLAVLLAASPAGAAGPAAAEGGTAGVVHAGRVAFDLVLLRPLGVVLTAVSLAGAAVAFPIAWPLGGGDHVIDYLVADPVERTFRRPLGDF